MKYKKEVVILLILIVCISSAGCFIPNVPMPKLSPIQVGVQPNHATMIDRTVPAPVVTGGNETVVPTTRPKYVYV